MMAKRSMDDWRQSRDYLPDFLKDFHDQKDAFKAMHDLIAVEKHDYAKEVSWVVGQCYVIDIFLWWAARYGYKLQKSHAKVDFEDLHQAVTAAKDARNTKMAAAMGLTRLGK